jgi:hypothetical protein
VKKVGYWWQYNGALQKVQNLRKKGQNFFGGFWANSRAGSPIRPSGQGHHQPVFAKYVQVP